MVKVCEDNKKVKKNYNSNRQLSVEFFFFFFYGIQGHRLSCLECISSGRNNLKGRGQALPQGGTQQEARTAV